MSKKDGSKHGARYTLEFNLEAVRLVKGGHPAHVGLNDKLVASNATLQIDLLGQCGSESLGHAPYSGTGGQVDFVRAANRSRGGSAFIVLPSTAKNDGISRIVFVAQPWYPRHHRKERYQLRRDRIWRGAIARQIGPTAGLGTDWHCTPQLPRRAH